MMSADQIARVFNSLFAMKYRTRLVGGGDEPIYRAALGEGGCHEIVFREDFAASALHEVAHWCIAGRRRRQREDYGYWYESDRGPAQQLHFQAVERRPQALEWVFSVASGRPFRVSFDNLEDSDQGGDGFRQAVRAAVHDYLERGLPPRAESFALALVRYRGGSEDFLAVHHYNELPR